MNKKAIKSVISKKLNEWYESITDEYVRNLVKKNTIVTGGCITSMLLNEEVKDFDLYFTDKQTVLAVTRYYVTRFNEAYPKKKADITQTSDGRVRIDFRSGMVSETLDDMFEDVFDVLPTEDKDTTVKTKYCPVYLSANAITLSDRIQIVIRFYGPVEEIHKNYDFVHTTNSYTTANETLTLTPAALESILTKQLVYVGSKYPLCSVIRTRKFIQRGWNVNAGQYLKMLFQCSQLDLTDISVLKDQLIGVDSAYFDKLITGLETKADNDYDFKLTSAYLTSIVDRIF